MIFSINQMHSHLLPINECLEDIATSSKMSLLRETHFENFNKKIALTFYKRYFFIRSLLDASEGRRAHPE